MRAKGELNHWSGEHIHALDPLRPYPQKVEWKPTGFWVDVDRDWYRWCKTERFRNETLAYRHRMTIADDARILRLTGPDALMKFTEEFAVPHPVLGPWLEGKSFFGPFHDSCIDWPRVAGLHQGIVIAPYCWHLRMDLMWYYGWDCASGCIWDASVLSVAAVYHKGRKVAPCESG